MTKPFRKFLTLFLLLGFVIFLVSGGLFILLGLGQGNGSSGLTNRQTGLQFVYPPDVNNQTVQANVIASLFISFGFAALITILAIELLRLRQHTGPDGSRTRPDLPRP